MTVAVSLVAVGLLAFGAVTVFKPSGIGTIDISNNAGDSSESFSPVSDYPSGSASEYEDTQTQAEGSSSGLPETAHTVYVGTSREITSAIDRVTSAVTEKTKKSGLFGRKDKEAETSASTKTTASAKTVSAKQTSSAAASSKTSASVAGTYEYSYAGFNPTYIEITDSNWEMVLVNRHYIISSDYKPKLAYSIAGNTQSKYLDYRVAPHYNEMYLAAAKDGIYLNTVSGYRSYELQKTNFERKINTYINQGYTKVAATQAAAKIILPPGTSEHNAGLAMDIISLEQSFENTKAFAWLQAHAQDYGFILRYPKDKEKITEIIYEPWHWRYVGVENAKKIKASGLCLEEYLGKTP